MPPPVQETPPPAVTQTPPPAQQEPPPAVAPVAPVQETHPPAVAQTPPPAQQEPPPAVAPVPPPVQETPPPAVTPPPVQEEPPLAVTQIPPVQEEPPLEVVPAPTPQEESSPVVTQMPTVPLVPAETPPATVVQMPTLNAILNSIYFEPDTAVLVESSRPSLDEVGRRLAADPDLSIHLRAYAAPFRTAIGRLMVSQERADFTRNYLFNNFGISPERFTIEIFGSTRVPQNVTNDWESYRAVEITTYNSQAVASQGLVNTAYFEPDTAVLIETSRPGLEALGRALAADPELRIHLRAYTAPFGTASSRLDVSQARAEFSRNYLMQNFGISPDRITAELLGSTRTPEHVTDDWASYRCVEFFIFSIPSTRDGLQTSVIPFQTQPAEIQRLFNSIYFEPDTAVMLETSRPALEAVGRQLNTDSSLRVLIRAYTAPFGTAGGRMMVSQIRADFSRNYLMQNFGISSDRINVELYGSTRTPENVTDNWTTYRCVEFLISSN